MTTYALKNYSKFQHYRDRKPPWVKLYRDLWRDRDFFRLADRSKLLFLGLTTIASITDNTIPDDPEWIAVELGLSVKSIDLNPLIIAGFLVLKQDASGMLADCQQLDDVEGEKSRDRDRGEGDLVVLGVPPAIDLPLILNANGKVHPPAALAPQDLLEAWNEQLVPLGLAAVKELSATRTQKARLRLKEHPTPDWWETFFAQMRASPLCLGLKPPKIPGQKPWRATFDWMIDNDTNALKVFEGRYV